MAAKAFEAVAWLVRTRSTLIRLNFCIVSNCSTMVSLLRRFLEAASLDRRTFGPGNPLMLHCTINVKRKIISVRYGALSKVSTSYTWPAALRGAPIALRRFCYLLRCSIEYGSGWRTRLE